MAPDVKALLDRAQQIFVPLDLEIGMQAALHQDAGSTQVDGLLDLVEDRFLRQDIALGMPHRAVESAEAAIFRTEIRVVDVAVDNVADYAFGMQLAAHRVGRHTDTDQVIALEHLNRFSAGHHTDTPGIITRSRSRSMARARSMYSRMP